MRNARWISVKDSLPDDERAVLVFERYSDESWEMACASYTESRDGNRQWLDHEGDVSSLVTHWMELPKPPGS